MGPRPGIVVFVAAVTSLSVLASGCHLLYGYESQSRGGGDGGAPAADAPRAVDGGVDGSRGDGPTDGPATEAAPPRSDAAQDVYAPDAATPDQQVVDSSTPDAATVAPSHAWSKTFGASTFNDRGYAVAVDSSGNVYVAGSFNGTVDFGDGSRQSNGASDVFVVSYTPAGTLRWAWTFGGVGSDRAFGVAVDGSGNVIIAGDYTGPLSFGGPDLPHFGGGDAFVASLSPAGAHGWSAGFGGADDELARGVAVDAAGNVSIAGTYRSAASFGGKALPHVGSDDGFVASFTPAGSHRWSEGFGSSAAETIAGVAADAAGNVHVTGSFYSTITIAGKKTLSSQGNTDGFVASFDVDGGFRWASSFGSALFDYGRGIAVDGAGNLYLTGSFVDSVSFGGATVAGKGGADLFVASLTGAGAHRWSIGGGGAEADIGMAIGVAGGGVYVAGYFYGSAIIGGRALASSGGADAFVAAHSAATGGPLWGEAVGGATTEQANGVAASASGRASAAGFFRAVVDFGDGPVTAGAEDVFVLSLDGP